MKHILLIIFDARLIERVHPRRIARHADHHLKEIQQFTDLLRIQTLEAQQMIGHAAVHIRFFRSQHRLLVHVMHGLARQVVQAV